MATGKRYYWIKLKESFLTSDTVDYLMGQKNGANYVVLYQMLLLKTINTEGRLAGRIGEVLIPYDVEKIQRDCKYFDIDTIRVALELYRSLGLVYEDTDGVLVMADHNNLVGSALTDDETRRRGAERQARYRLAHKKDSVTVTDKVTLFRNGEIDNRDIDIDKDIDNIDDIDSIYNINNKDIDNNIDIDSNTDIDKDIDISKSIDNINNNLDNINNLDNKYILSGLSEKNKILSEIVNYLNQSIGTHFRDSTPNTRKLIKARLKEGYTVDDFKTVIDKKVKDWGNDPKMQKFLRPETLFGNKFEGYLNEREKLSRAAEVDSWL